MGWAEASLWQDRAKRRRRRQATVFVTLVCGTAAVGVVAATFALGWWSLPAGDDADTGAAIACPVATPTAASIRDVEVNVYNATSLPGLANGVARGLQARGFTVDEIANDPTEAAVPEPAVIRHGPEGLLAARTVAAQVADSVLLDDGRQGAVVDLVIGDTYRFLRAPAEATALIVATPPPQPAGCVTPSATPTPAP